MEYNPRVESIHYLNHGIDVLRLDLIHPHHGGNKYFKLKYNLQKAKSLGLNTILTFGGAHSNHVYSTAAAGKEFGFSSIGIIRGEEGVVEQSPTLQFALKCGMKLHFISREKYRDKTEENILDELKPLYGNFYLIPEGGSNYEGVKGCTEILSDDLKKYDHVFCACGTAATFSGIKISSGPTQKIIGVSVLKGENKLIDEANKWFEVFNSEKINLFDDKNLNHSTILNDYHFGGYAKYAKELVDFKIDFEKKYSIALDHIYTSKLFFAVFDLIKKGKLNQAAKVLIVHSGGSQGNMGFENRFGLI